MRLTALHGLDIARRLVRANARFELRFLGNLECELIAEHQASLDLALQQSRQDRLDNFKRNP